MWYISIVCLARYDMFVFSTCRLLFAPIYIQHNQSVSVPMPSRKAGSVVANYKTGRNIYKVVWPYNANRTECEAKT